jgi:hypothetical protein
VLITTERMTTWVDENLRPFGLVGVIVGGAIVYLAAVAWSWQHTSYDVWGAVLIAPMLVGIAYPFARYAAHNEADPTIVRLILGALAAKLAMAVVRYVVAFGVYGGTADARVYHQVGAVLSRQFRNGDLHTNGEALTGTGFIRVFTGVLYTITGPTIIGGFLLYAFLGFWGLYFFYRAFTIAVPNGNHRRYARLVFFLPSLLFWPSSIGKESWMCLWLGVAAFGAAKALTHTRGAFPLIALGLGGCAFVRPHVALLFFIGLSTAYLLRPGRSHSIFGPVPKIVGTLALFVVGFALLGQVENYFGVDDLNQGGTTEALSIATQRSDTGGSQFHAVSPTSPQGFGYAVVTVLFRPFPQEAGSLQGLLASAEMMGVLGLAIVSSKRSLRIFTHLRTWSYGTLALVYTLFFCYAFASISNFGILTRQRVQVLPFLLVLVCLPGPHDEATVAPDAAR